jgi:Predicted metal-binding protein
MVTRREWLRVALGGAAATMASGMLTIPAFAAAPVPMTVYKTPTCGCCKKWVEHVEAHGFKVTVKDMDDLSEVKSTFGIPEDLQGCHTATVGKYVVEGHVPADLIQKMLKDQPAIAGLAVPGMPMGSPGMEGGRKDPYDVVAFDRKGKRSVYAKR